MKIVTEIGWGNKKGGMRRVAIRTLNEMVKLRPEHEYFSLSSVTHDSFEETSIKQVQLQSPPFIPKLVWDQFLFPHVSVPIECAKIKPDLIHHTSNIASYFGKTPSVVTIHDMTPFVVPETFRKDHLIYQRLYFKHAVRKAKKIITVSQNSKKDICDILKVPDDKVVVAPLAGDLDLSPTPFDIEKVLEKYGITKPFIFYVGSIHPRKNVTRSVEAFSDVKEKKQIPHQLVVAGSLKWMTESIFQSPAFNRVSDDVVFPGVVSDLELACLFSTCDVFLWPSLYEGFGLPVLEAISFGAPVVTSNSSSLPEITGDAAFLVNPHSTEDIADALWQLIDNQALADDLRKKGRARAKQFSWEKTAKIIWDVFESVA